ncbi:hypothetical protein GCM10028856_08940 [Halopiger thermotolerans]
MRRGGTEPRTVAGNRRRRAVFLKTMVTEAKCANCGTVVVAFETLEPVPIDREACPNCGGTEFAFVER